MRMPTTTAARVRTVTSSKLPPTSGIRRHPRQPRHRRRSGNVVVAASASNPEVYMDIDIEGEPAGRLRFTLRPDLAPKTVENFIKLSDGSAAGINPSLTYKA